MPQSRPARTARGAQPVRVRGESVDEIDPLGLVPCTGFAGKLQSGEMYLYRALQDGYARQAFQS